RPTYPHHLPLAASSVTLRLSLPSAFSSLFLFFFHCSGAHRDLHSFPTRRSSDLRERLAPREASLGHEDADLARDGAEHQDRRLRSEEHTSELQSRFDLVCRLLLEKKKKNETKNKTMHEKVRAKDTGTTSRVEAGT